MEYTTNSAKETQDLAKKLAKNLTSRVITLTGDLGAGKTTFVQGLAEGLGIKEKIISPTFVLIRQHPIPNSNKTLFHIDLYRLGEIKDLQDLGLDEILDNPNHIILIEWAEKLGNLLPEKAVRINVRQISENVREIEVV